MPQDDQVDPTAPEREDEDDHDLLTYGEARVRLYEELEAQTKLVAELEAAGPSPELDKAKARLDALRSADERNRQQPINDENFEHFFGYKGSARRNT